MGPPINEVHTLEQSIEPMPVDASARPSMKRAVAGDTRDVEAQPPEKHRYANALSPWGTGGSECTTLARRRPRPQGRCPQAREPRTTEGTAPEPPGSTG